MRLELNIIHIEDVIFSDRTDVSDGILSVHREELERLLLQDERLARIDIELAHPGESCRILQVSDVIEPRAKIGDNADDFPGVIGRQETVGEGRTCVLRGTAVIINDQSEKAGLHMNRWETLLICQDLRPA